MGEEASRKVNWKTGLAVGAGVIAAAGLAVISYKLLRSRRDGAGAAPSPSNDESPEKSSQSDIGTPVKNGGGVQTGKQETPKSHYDQSIELKQEGNDHYKKQRYDDAIGCYQQALSLCPKDKAEDISKLNQNVAAVYTVMASQARDPSEQTGHWRSVVEYCTRALELNKRYVKALTRRLKAYDALEMRHDALLDVTRVVIVDEAQGANMALIITRLMRELGKEESAAHFPTLGPMAPTNHSMKNYLESFVWTDDLSEKRLQRLWEGQQRETFTAQKAEPESQVSEKSEEEGAAVEDAKPEVTTTTSDTEGEEDVAENVEGGATEATQDSVNSFAKDPFVVAAEMFRNKQYHGIIEQLTEAVDNGSPVFLPHALLLRGTFYTMWRDNVKALKDLDAVIETEDIENEMVMNALVKEVAIYAGIPDNSKVEDCLDRCFQLQEDFPDALIHKARVKLESPEDLMSSVDEVIEVLKRATSLAPNSPYALYSLGLAYHRAASISQSPQLLNQAVNTFETAIRKFPVYGDGLVLYSMCLQDIGQVSKADEFLSKAMKAEPENPHVYLSAGLMAMATANSGKAREQFQKAIEVDSSCVQAYDSLASLELQAGSPQGALDLYSRACRFAKSQTELSQIMVAREVISAQQQVCQEYGVSFKDLMSRVLPAQGM